MSHSWLSSKDQFKPAEAVPHIAFSRRNSKLLEHCSIQLHAVQAQQVLAPHLPKSYYHDLQMPNRAAFEEVATFPKLLLHAPLCPSPPRAPLRLLASPGQMVTMVGGSKTVSNLSLAGTMHILPHPAAQLNARPSPRFPC